MWYLWCAGPSNQACVGADRPTSSSLVSLYPALGYRAIMQDMSPTAFGKMHQHVSLLYDIIYSCHKIMTTSFIPAQTIAA